MLKIFGAATQDDLGENSIRRDDASSGPATGDAAERLTPYDQFRYPGQFYPQASPERMAALATLFGVAPAPVERCRVLELGCGEGGHLVPLAYVLPDSKFLGVDLSQGPVTRARELADRLGTRNIEFRTEDFTTFPADAGCFDYIIAHGVYSWVPAEAQRALLAICERHLTPDGLAYISYNAYPGGHLRQVPRDLALFHTRDISDLATKIHEARHILDFILEGMPSSTIQRELLGSVTKGYKTSDASMLFDLLSEVNEPFYFLDFMEAAAARGLQFVAESDVRLMRTAHLPEVVRQWLDALSDRLLREQYLDFINWRGFRATILCRVGQRLDLDVTPDRMERLMIASSLAPDHPITDLQAEEEIEFRGIHGQVIRCKDAVLKAAFLELRAAFPRALRYGELRAGVCRRLRCRELGDTVFEAKFVRILVSSLANGLADFYTYQAPFSTTVSDRPLASAMARVQAETAGSVSSMYLASFMLEDPILRGLLLLLDGTRDHQQLRIALETRLRGVDTQVVAADVIERSLQTLANYGMLIG